MANIFHSDEVYRKIKKRTDVGAQDPIVPIRGMYVVGIPEIPEYNNSGIMVKKVEADYPTICDFTEATTNAHSDSIIGIIGFNTSEIQLDRLTTKSVDVHGDSIIGVIGFNTNDMVLQRYATKYHNAYSDSIIGIIGFNTSDGLTIQRYNRQTAKSQPEPTLMVKKVQVGAVTISDIEVGRTINDLESEVE